MRQREPAAMENWLALVQAEYREMPGLCLTKSQVRRLWALDAPTCDVLLERLERDMFLRCTAGQRYVRVEGCC
jgi:hypothetical protein